MDRERIETLSDDTWPDFRDAPFAVLVLAQTGCPHCDAWSRELEEFLAGDEEFSNVRFGKLLLDRDDIDAFKKENADWLEIVPGVPFNALFRDGQPVTSMAGAGVERLVTRLRKRLGASSRDV